MKPLKTSGLALCLGLFALGACAPRNETGTETAPAAPASAAPATGNATASAWTHLVDDWIESDLKANPNMAASAGRHEYDGLFPDWSEAGLKAEIQRLHDWRAKAEGFDASSLPDAQKFEREYLLAVIDGRLFWLETADGPHRNPTYYGLDPAMYLDRPYADPATRMVAYTKWASNLPAAAAQIKANLQGPLPKAYIDIGMHSVGPLGEFLKTDVPKAFAGAGTPEQQAAFAKANSAAAAALADLQTHLQGLRKTQTGDFALGADKFAQMLHATERVDTPLDELQKIGEADLQRNLAALDAACKQFAPGKRTQECVAKAMASKPEGGDFIGYARKQLVELKQFVQDKHIVTIPGTEEAKVKQAPPYNAQNSAYIDIPGPYEKDMPSFYTLAAPDPSWPKRKQLDYIPAKSVLLFTSTHEVWPGHFLQFLHSNRSQSMFGKLYVGYAFAEGWAHYSEEMMWEEGLGNGDPETHIGQLSEALLRDVRFLSAIGLHTQGMTLEQSKRMFVEQGFQDEGNAEQQAARGSYDPAYLNYTLGKLMIRQLRADWCGQRGGADDKACWHDFHDAFLAFGGPPIPLVRGAMLRQAPSSGL